MKRRVVTRPRADRDIDERFLYLATEAGLVVAGRFYGSIREDIAGLLELPERGGLARMRSSQLGSSGNGR